MALEHIIGRLRMAKASLNRDTSARGAPPSSTEAALGLSYRKGDRVIDTVTGEEVEIVTGSKTHVIVQSTRRQND
jgi:lambda repressor-like predicted transcriptional regulator